jgi:hypothetical protein
MPKYVFIYQPAGWVPGTDSAARAAWAGFVAGIATASSIPPSRSWTGPRSVRSAPPPSWLVDAASLEEAVTLAKGCRASRSAVVSRLASSASQRVSGSADLRVLEDTVKA